MLKNAFVVFFNFWIIRAAYYFDIQAYYLLKKRKLLLVGTINLNTFSNFLLDASTSSAQGKKQENIYFL